MDLMINKKISEILKTFYTHIYFIINCKYKIAKVRWGN